MGILGCIYLPNTFTISEVDVVDLTKCANEDCPLRNGCCRFTAKANPYGQSYSDFKFKQNKDEKAECDYYWNDTTERGVDLW